VRLRGRITSLERRGSVGAACRSCGMTRTGLPAGWRLVASAPQAVAHIRLAAANAANPLDPPCGACGRPTVFRIPMPERAREGEPA
jgi:hypothetical protein